MFRSSLLVALLSLSVNIAADVNVVKHLTDNTLKVQDNRIVLYGIHVPKPTEHCIADGESWPCGAAATLRLNELIKSTSFNCTAVLELESASLARCQLGDTDLAHFLVEEGWAVTVDTASTYTRMEHRARENQLGIWRGGFSPPAEWRQYPDIAFDPYVDLQCSSCAARKQ